jgi:ribose 5-phosphate isomerase A
MALAAELFEALLDRYITGQGEVVSFGTSELSEEFVKKIAIKIEAENVDISVVPTSARIAAILSEMNVPTTTLNEEEIDIAIEFVDQVDQYFNFIKRDSHSLVRDKMIAQSADELIVVAKEKHSVKRLSGMIPMEIAIFGWKRTLNQLSKFGEARLRIENGIPVTTETNYYLADVLVDDLFSLDEFNLSVLQIPGVIETGIFIGYADRVVLHNGRITVKSRMDYNKQNEISNEQLEGSFTI